MGSTWLCLLDGVQNVTPSNDGQNWKYLAKGSGDMVYKTLELSPSDITPSTKHAQFGYEYAMSWEGVKATDFTIATIETDNYNSKYAAETTANTMTLYFAKMPESTLGMYIFVQGGMQVDPSQNDPVYYSVDEINTIMGFGKQETTNTASYAHNANTYFVWKGALVKATSAISVGDTISSSNTSSTTVLSLLEV